MIPSTFKTPDIPNDKTENQGFFICLNTCAGGALFLLPGVRIRIGKNVPGGPGLVKIPVEIPVFFEGQTAVFAQQFHGNAEDLCHDVQAFHAAV